MLASVGGEPGKPHKGIRFLLNFSVCNTRLRIQLQSPYWAPTKSIQGGTCIQRQLRRKQVSWVAPVHENVSTPPKVSQGVRDSCGTFHPQLRAPIYAPKVNHTLSHLSFS